MSIALQSARRIYDLTLDVVHPLVDAFLPVTYTTNKVRRHKRRLDPHNARSRRELHPDTLARLWRIADALGLGAKETEAAVREAGDVTLPDAARDDTAALASPMCFEDRCTIYLVGRAVRPSVAVETGVANGVSSAYLLAAMDTIGRGELHSVELSNDPRVGQLIPDAFRSRWHLHTGGSLDVLPGLFAKTGPIDLFIHDSLHLCSHMEREFALAWAHLRPGGVLCSHDILTTNAFPRFVRTRRSEIETWVAGVNFGVVRKRAKRVS